MADINDTLINVMLVVLVVIRNSQAVGLYEMELFAWHALISVPDFTYTP